MESPTVRLPAISDSSTSVLSFLNSIFNNKQPLDLSESNRLVSDLQAQCDQLTDCVADLTRRLHTSIESHESSNQIGDAFAHVKSQLSVLNSSTSISPTALDRGGGGGGEVMISEELHSLAKEVRRVHTVRNYAEIALKLDQSVGDIEDAVTAVMNVQRKRSAKNSEESCLGAINSLKLVENILASVAETYPRWSRLVSAVDNRVDRALAILRPQTIADYRALLSSLGWPPPLSGLSSADIDTRKTSDSPNPLLNMHGEIKKKYFENFVALCNLQELQQRRKSRQLEGHNRDIAMHQPLWAIEELLNPIFLVCQQHFTKWIDKPEFIFALVYKITRDYVEPLDDLLQPLIDEASLKGYSCREEWVAALVNSLATYLAEEIFTGYVSQMSEENETDVQTQARIAWLHLVDLMIAFDKKVQSLIQHSGIVTSLQEDENLQRISTLSVFCDRPDWLHLWTEIELGDILCKLKPEIDNERNWTNPHGATHFPGTEDYKSPVISSIFLQQISSVIERSRSLPTTATRYRYVHSIGAPIIQKLLECWLTKCLEAEGLTALVTDDALIKVTTSINSTHHLESVLREWSEDLSFLEIGLEQDDQLGSPIQESSPREGLEEPLSTMFDAEIGKVEEFRREWVDKIITIILRGFDALVRDYAKNRKQWQGKSENGEGVTKSFIVSLDFLQGKLSILQDELNKIDFTTVWRSLASGLDRLIFTSVLMSYPKFSEEGVVRLGNDMDALFGLFRAWCLRPEGFFPRVSECMKLLKMDENQAQQVYIGRKEWMTNNRIRHLRLAEIERILSSRAFVN
ncbi:hypothetical protein V2J09_023257 [Rumex salicifolius]